MGEPVFVRRRRRPALSAALKAARAAGLTVKSATTTEDGISLVFDNGETVTGTGDDWDRRLKELQDGKH